MSNDDHIKKCNNQCALKLISFVTLILGVGVLIACIHMKSNLPASGEALNSKQAEDLLKLSRILISSVIPGMSGLLITLSIILWSRSRKLNQK